MKKQKGFSLLEVVIAMGIVAVGILSVLPVYSTGLEISRRTSKSSEASFVLKNLVEQEKAKGFSTTDVGQTRIALPAADKMPGSRMQNMFKEIQVLSRSNTERWFNKRVIVSWDYSIGGTTKTKQIDAIILIVD